MGVGLNVLSLLDLGDLLSPLVASRDTPLEVRGAGTCVATSPRLRCMGHGIDGAGENKLHIGGLSISCGMSPEGGVVVLVAGGGP